MRALLGPYDKTGLIELARGLQGCGVECVATDGTRRALAAAGISAVAVSELTGHPEMLDGRVKTLHPAIHAGILARRDLPEHLAQLAAHGYAAIDIVVVGLYPFSATVARGASAEEIVENIDIGGPALIRAAAKNADAVTVVVSPSQYGELLEELRSQGGVRASTRRRFAAQAFAHVAAYDAAVAAWMRDGLSATDGSNGDAAAAMPEAYTVGGSKLHHLRYGENPHQRGAVYSVGSTPGGMAHAEQLQGPSLSFTNWLDVDAARRLVLDFEEPAAAIIKHTNPCGFAVGDELVDAYRKAHACDPRAAFGGIVGLNRPLDGLTATEVARTFLEAVVAPAVTEEAAALLQRKERLRLLTCGSVSPSGQHDVRSIDGGLLVQTLDRVALDRTAMRVATRRAPTDAEWEQLLIAWRVCRHVKSNAIVVVRDGAAVGVGAGQMSRVEAVELAVQRAGERVRAAVAASDAFFPFADGVEACGAAGVTALIQPGGSRADSEVVAAADALGMAMVMAGERHFRH